jgi:hypothetical protein
MSSQFLTILSHMKNCRKSMYATKVDAYYRPLCLCAAAVCDGGHWYERLEDLLSNLSESCEFDVHKYLPFIRSSIGDADCNVPDSRVLQPISAEHDMSIDWQAANAINRSISNTYGKYLCPGV